MYVFFIAVLYLRHDDNHSKGDTAFRNKNKHHDNKDMEVFLIEHEHHHDDPVDSDDFESRDN